MIGGSGFPNWNHCCRFRGTFSAAVLSRRILRPGMPGWRFWLRSTGAKNLHCHRAFKTKLMRQNAEQPPGRSTGITTLMLEVFHLLDRDTKPLGKLGLGHAGMLAQSQNTA